MRETWCYGRLWRVVVHRGAIDTVSFRCKKHPKYFGVNTPRANCEGCWRIWLGVTTP